MNKMCCFGIRSLATVFALTAGAVLFSACLSRAPQTLLVAVGTPTKTDMPVTVTQQISRTPLPTLSPTLSPTAVPSPSPDPPTLTATATVRTDESDSSGLEQRKLQATAAPETTYTYVFPIKAAKVSYGPSHHDYNATDIFCAEGSSFVAVTSGVVAIVIPEDTWSPKNDDPALRSGLAVGIVGDDGVQYYGSHLSAIAEGVTVGLRVQAGALLGYTGKSGNARGTPPHLHFGISRPTDPDDWRVRRGEMNPFEFLNAWSKGEALQPLFLPTEEEE